MRLLLALLLRLLCIRISGRIVIDSLRWRGGTRSLERWNISRIIIVVLVMPRNMAVMAPAPIWPRSKCRKSMASTIGSGSERSRLQRLLMLQRLYMLLVDLLRVLRSCKVKLTLY